MVVTSVKLRLVTPGRRKILAVGSMVLNGCFQIEEINIVEMNDGRLIVAMPSHFKEGRFRDLAHPITVECRKSITDAVLDEYETLTSPRPTAKLSE